MRIHDNGICDGWECSHHPVDQRGVTIARAWLRTFATRRQSINTRLGSYWLKHIVERTVGEYVSNGSLIVAAMLEGYDVHPIAHGNLNAFFNVSLANAPAAVREAA